MADAESSPPPTTSAADELSPPPQAAAAAGVCGSCGGTDAAASPPPSWSGISPPPTYRPIRAPAINAPTSTNATILAPVPLPLPVPVASPPYHFQAASKQISTPDDILRFHSSPSGRHFLGFIASLSHSVRSRKLSDPVPSPLSRTLSSILFLLSIFSRWVDEIPPAPHPGRYGNPAFRSWHARLSNDRYILNLVVPIVIDIPTATIEILSYLSDSFGDPFRIDYGTRHETNFAAFLYCLARLGLIREEDYTAVVTHVFLNYQHLMRKLQFTYSLEPAGVLGLDDYHFLPFIFGSAQLVDHKCMKPKSIHNQDILDNFNKEYFYISAIAIIKMVKKGPFSKHSPLLEDISRVQTWSKVNSGLLRMYKAEVLEKGMIHLGHAFRRFMLLEDPESPTKDFCETKNTALLFCA